MATDDNEDDGRFSGSSGQESSSSSSESESDEDSRHSSSDTDDSMWEYGQTLTPGMFRNDYLPNEDTHAQRIVRFDRRRHLDDVPTSKKQWNEGSRNTLSIRLPNSRARPRVAR